MRILALGQHHDFNACLYDTETLEFKYLKEERLSGLKHDAGVNFIKLEIKAFSPEKIYFCWGNNENQMSDLSGQIAFKELSRLRNKIEESGMKSLTHIENRLFHTLDKLSEVYELSGDTVLHWVQHDYAHILSGWMLCEEYSSIEYGVSIDGGGPDWNTKLILKTPFDLEKVNIVFSEKKNSYGHLFSHLGSLMNLTGSSLDMAGKLMGLQAYGKVSANYKADLPINTLRSYLNEYVINKSSIFKGEENLSENNAFLDFLATTHLSWSDCVLSYFQDYIPTNAKTIFSGGCAQNTVTNWNIINEYPSLVPVPHCYDGGLSLGSLAYALLTMKIRLPSLPDYPYIQANGLIEKPSQKTINQVAELLSNGKIVGWVQGNGECGPRALGNRSILMHPGISGAKDLLNSKIKKREYWRPFAPSIIEEYASEWFDMKGLKSSPYMMVAFPVHEGKVNKISSVIHEDGSSRIQTVAKNNNPIFYELLNAFYKLTDIPILLNTSLNKGGGPIVGNRKEDAVEIFHSTGMDALCIGSELLIK